MGLVPKTTKAEVKVFGGFSMVRIFGIILSAGVGIMLSTVQEKMMRTLTKRLKTLSILPPRFQE